MSPQSKGLSHSVQVRLVAHSKAIGMEPLFIFTRYAIERFLYRLSRSPYADRFVLKGALLMLVWLGETIRPTRDVDLLGLGDLSDASLAQIFRDICLTPVEPDGVEFNPLTLAIAQIRQEDAYGGKRVTFAGGIGSVRIRMQVDVGIGDAVRPSPVWIEYPSLLQGPLPRVRAYVPEVAIAEKLHAMVELGSRNSRMRDFFDVRAIAGQLAFKGGRLVQAVRSTFERRNTQVPDDVPLALRPEFTAEPDKRAQWMGFRKKNRLTAAPAELLVVVQDIAAFLGPVIHAARHSEAFDLFWPPGGPWRPKEGAGRD